MIFPVVLVTATFFISASLGSEDTCQEKEAQISQLQKEIFDLQKSRTQELLQLMDYNVIYERLNLKSLITNLNVLLNEKNKEIDLLKDHISDLKNTTTLLTNKLNKGITKIGELIQTADELTNQLANINNQTNSVTPTQATLAEHWNIKNETSNTIALPDSCPLSQKEIRVLQEIQIPGLDPMTVVCFSHEKIGSGWLLVYSKNCVTYDTSNRTYEEYVTGYGKVGTNYGDQFFIGLDTLHHLTNGKRHELSLWTGDLICDNFLIGNRSEGYIVKDTGECTGYSDLSMRKGTKFSTIDHVEEFYPDPNFTKNMDFGWWFDSTTNPKLLCSSVKMYLRPKN